MRFCQDLCFRLLLRAESYGRGAGSQVIRSHELHRPVDRMRANFAPPGAGDFARDQWSPKQAGILAAGTCGWGALPRLRLISWPPPSAASLNNFRKWSCGRSRILPPGCLNYWRRASSTSQPQACSLPALKCVRSLFREPIPLAVGKGHRLAAVDVVRLATLRGESGTRLSVETGRTNHKILWKS
jgi:hypothetical protein